MTGYDKKNVVRIFSDRILQNKTMVTDDKNNTVFAYDRFILRMDGHASFSKLLGMC
jgi:hypothetical protein